MQAGDIENAKHCLGRAITVKPSIGHTKYLSLAQLMQGRDALQLYNKAIEIISQIQNQQSVVSGDHNHDEKAEEMEVTDQGVEERTANGNKEQNGLQSYKNSKDQNCRTKTDVSREMSNAFCAVAELWMTDLCDEGEAEVECGLSVEKAVEADQTNPEAWQTKSRLHLVKSEFEVWHTIPELILIRRLVLS